MAKSVWIYVFIIGYLTNVFSPSLAQENSSKIDRVALVSRHNVKVTSFDVLSPLTVGNGEFAFTTDATGLQTFPDLYEKGIYLGTQAQWGWHSFPDTSGYTYDETLKYYDFHGRKIGYHSQLDTPERGKKASNYFRVNPHRLHLGMIGFELINGSGAKIKPEEITNIKQELNLWKGEIRSHFEVLGEPVDVVTICLPQQDILAVNIKSPLIKKGLLHINFRFPNPTGRHTDGGYNWNQPDSHQSEVVTVNTQMAVIKRVLDATRYFVFIGSAQNIKVKKNSDHYFILSPAKGDETISFSCKFSKESTSEILPKFGDVSLLTSAYWESFWKRGGAVDLTGSTDVRASELERRVVLSQYLMAVQCAGSVPPQETGLTFNSWFGKYHLEMHWWHAAHFALWNRSDLLEKSLDWYHRVLPKAKTLAEMQGFEGARWQKMTDTTGNYCPSSIGSVLIWQQPHIIYFAEMLYRQNKSAETLEKYKDLVFETARFMASYAWYEKEKDRYILGPALIPAQERLPPETTINPPYELAYWYWGLNVAKQWRIRLGLPVEKKWDEVIAKLSPLAKKDGLYLAAESDSDTYSKTESMSDHPSVLAAYGILPSSPLVNRDTMKVTFDYIMEHWHWSDTWGWDFPMTAMTATRLGLPEKAIDALFMESPKNTYLRNGHNYKDESLRIYLPANGGLLAAIAMMCAGYDGCSVKTPGFPKDGTWKVRWENLNPVP